MGGIKAIYEMIPTSVKKELKKEAIEKAKKFISKIKKDKKEDVNIKKYLETKYIEFSYLMPLALDQRVVLLKELYYPLTIKRKGEVIEIKGFDISLFKTKNRIIIEDDAGMGKSTLMKFLFLTNYDSMDKDYIPVFFELRNYDTKLLFKENIINSFKKIECDIDDDFFKRKLI
ncbi:MAG: hypothetical protein MJH09_09255 [Cetobacterium sp.]|nr:hypothetical protein [Cetobacterium sp.]